MERKNLILGSILISLFTLLGFYLETQLGAGAEWQNSTRHHMWKTAHLHGNLFGVLNIIYGLLIFYLKKPADSFLKTGGLLAFTGGILFPFALFMGGVIPQLVYLAPIGGLCMIVSWFLLSFTLIRNK